VVFTVDDLATLSAAVSAAWTAAADRDWSVPAGTLEWSCLRTADHAVDCVYAPALFLASRRVDDYPSVGVDLTLGGDATPALLVESLGIATRLLTGAVAEAGGEPGVRAILFRRPSPTTGAPADFPPRAALELALHAHDVCDGLGVAFEPPADGARRLREHTRPWPLWESAWGGPPGRGDDPWRDLLTATGRRPTDPRG